MFSPSNASSTSGGNGTMRIPTIARTPIATTAFGFTNESSPFAMIPP